MTGPGSRTGVTYQQMVEYVSRVTDPMEEHMSAHDVWHRDRLTAEQQSRQALLLGVTAVVISAIGVISVVLIALLHH